VDINLLPRETAPSKSQQKALSAANKIAMFFCGAFLLLVLFGGGLYLFFNSRLDTAKKEGEGLTVNIRSLQSTESSLILLKDRVQKISTVLDSRVNEGYFSKQNEVLALAPEEVSFDKSEIDVERSKLGIKLIDSLSLVSLFSGLRASSNFSSIVIDEFSFNSVSGFMISLDVF
jgi:hypothetical protein